MSNKLDLKGQRFGRLEVIESAENIAGKTAWLCQCDCGNKKVISTRHLRSGVVLSCGCLNAEKRKERFKDLTGFENDNFRVVKKASSQNQRVMWFCECKHCGKLVELHSNNIDNYKSCGCLKSGASKEYMESIRDVESLKTTKPTAKSTTGVRGVYHNKKKNRYIACINVDKKTKYLGSSKDFQIAVKMRHDAEKEFWGIEDN